MTFAVWNEALVVQEAHVSRSHGDACDSGAEKHLFNTQ